MSKVVAIRRQTQPFEKLFLMIITSNLLLPFFFFFFKCYGFQTIVKIFTQNTSALRQEKPSEVHTGDGFASAKRLASGTNTRSISHVLFLRHVKSRSVAGHSSPLPRRAALKDIFMASTCSRRARTEI